MNKRVVALIVFLLLITSIVSYFLFIKTKNCDTVGCFEKSSAECTRAKIYTQESGGTVTFYKIKGENSGDCVLYVKITEVGEASPDVAASFEGKDMTCNI